MSNTTFEQIKNILANELDLNIEVETIHENSSLLEDGLNVDSLAIVELISILEEEFNIQFDEEDLNPENFSSVKALADFIDTKNRANM